MKQFVACCLLVFAMAFVSCNRYVVHPGSVDKFDSLAYDALLDAQSVIDTARPLLAANQLAPKFKPLLDNLIAAYNIASPAWKAYHAGGTGNTAQLQTDLTNLSAAVAALRKGN